MECRPAEKSSGQTKPFGSSNVTERRNRPWNSLSSAPIRKIAPPCNRPLTVLSVDGKDFDHEYRLLMPDGSVKYVHAVARAVRDASGSIEFIGAVTDVTAAREAERKLRRSEAYLAEAQRLSHTSSWAWDVRRREFVYRSPGSVSPVWARSGKGRCTAATLPGSYSSRRQGPGYRSGAAGRPRENGFRSRFSHRSSGRFDQDTYIPWGILSSVATVK